LEREERHAGRSGPQEVRGTPAGAGPGLRLNRARDSD
jgi:hypothetical protein